MGFAGYANRALGMMRVEEDHMDTRTAGRMGGRIGGKIGGRSRSKRKVAAARENLKKAHAALAAKRARARRTLRKAARP
jgi:hypothetical protein